MQPTDLLLPILHFALQSVLGSLPIDPSRSVEDLKAERQAATAMLGEL